MPIIKRKRYTSPDGKIQYRKPPIWNNTSPITDEYLEAHGWTIEVETIEAHEPPKRYSKLKIMEKLQEAKIWNDVKTTLQNSGAWDAFLIAQDLASDNPLFLSMVPVITKMLPKTFNVQEMLTQCEI